MGLPLDSQAVRLIDSCRSRGHRALFLLLSSDPGLAVRLLHFALRGLDAPCVLWCHRRKTPAFAKHPKKLRQALQRQPAGAEAQLDLLQAATDLHFCPYGQAGSLLGRTFSAAVLQDLQALTPNLLAQTIETVAGGGVVLLLAPSRGAGDLQAFRELAMDAHAHFRTPGHPQVLPLFNGRLLRHLLSCPDALVLDSSGRVAAPPAFCEAPPAPLPPSHPPAASDRPLLGLCSTADQAALLDALTKALEGAPVAAVTAPRGRGKSAALGLAVAAALATSDRCRVVWVAAAAAEAVGTLFDFAARGLERLGLKFGRAGTPTQQLWVERTAGGRQTVRFLNPVERKEGSNFAQLQTCDLLCIDEAAAIPLPLVRAMIDASGGCPVFLASTVNGYEGTGRSLSLKMLSELRSKSMTGRGRPLLELSLQEAIRYRSGDRLEAWLSQLLCLNCEEDAGIKCEPPPAKDCQLVFVNRAALFSGQPTSDLALHRLTALFVASHYRNSPNDLQLLADSPSQRLFALIAPPKSACRLPEILAAVQVTLEGGIPRAEVERASVGSQRPAGDLMAWTLSQQFCQPGLAVLRGARVLRIAVHADLQGRGFGSRALQLLHDYYNGDIKTTGSAFESPGDTDPSDLPPLFQDLSERPAETVTYIGVAFGLNAELYRFWRRAGYLPVYVRHTRSELTGEHSCLMLRAAGQTWIPELSARFREDFVRVSTLSFRHLPLALGLQLLRSGTRENDHSTNLAPLSSRLSAQDVAQLRSYCAGACDFHMLLKLMPTLAELFFTGRASLRPSPTLQEEAILFAMGCQGNARVEVVTEALTSILRRDVTAGQVLGLLKRLLTRFLDAVEAEGKADLTETTWRKRYAVDLEGGPPKKKIAI